MGPPCAPHSELRDGIQLLDANDNLVARSPQTARHGIKMVILSRVGMAIPSMGMPGCHCSRWQRRLQAWCPIVLSALNTHDWLSLAAAYISTLYWTELPFWTVGYHSCLSELLLR